jgi:hypothetical protein
VLGLSFAAVAILGGGVALYALVQPQASAGGPAVPEMAAAVQPGAIPEAPAPSDQKAAPIAAPEITPVSAEPVAVATDAGRAPKANPVKAAARAPRAAGPRSAEAPDTAQKKSVQSTITDFGGRR